MSDISAVVTSVEGQVRPASKRFEAVDLVRGLAMVFMALNHSAAFIPGLELDANYSWSRPLVLHTPSSMRPEAWLNVLQGTPIFFLLAGFGVAFFEQSRRKRQWTEAHITRYFIIRGMVLVLIDLLLLRNLVLVSIGLCLWFVAVLRRLPFSVLVLLVISVTLGVQTFYEVTPISQTYDLWRMVFLYPSSADPVFFGYPVIQWLAMIGLGYLSGRVAIVHRDKFREYAITVGFAAFVLWLVMALGGHFGHLHGGHPIILTKHPPSLSYLTFYIAITFPLLAFFSNAQSLVKSPVGHFLVLFGQVSFIFYITHFYVIRFISLILLQFALPPFVTYLFVIVITIAILFPVCQRYKKLRRQYPKSILQYL